MSTNKLTPKQLQDILHYRIQRIREEMVHLTLALDTLDRTLRELDKWELDKQ